MQEKLKKASEAEQRQKDIAVLFRTHTDARPVVEALLARKLPFEMKEHLPNLYEHFIAKDIQAYFRLAMKCAGRQDLLQVMNRPKRYLPETVCRERGHLSRYCGTIIGIKTG